MQNYKIAGLLESHAAAGKSYLEFLKVESMSAGLYVLPAGSEDRQQPHTEDEIYYVVRGAGMFRCGEEDVTANDGDILFVPANMPHRFHTITEELTLLVLFAPAEYSLATSPDAGSTATTP